MSNQEFDAHGRRATNVPDSAEIALQSGSSLPSGLAMQMLAGAEPQTRTGGAPQRTETSGNVGVTPSTAVELYAYKGSKYAFAGVEHFHQGIPQSMSDGKTVDGGKVQYDINGNVSFYSSHDDSVQRAYHYHDVAEQLASLPANPALGAMGPFTGNRSFQVRTDLLNQTDEKFGRRAKLVQIDPQWLHLTGTVDQTLSSVYEESSGKVWLRDKKSGLMQAFKPDSTSKKLVPTGEYAKDSELIPRTISSNAEDSLYGDVAKPKDNVNAGAIQQGNMGDCVFEAVLGGLADGHPQSVVNMVEDHKDGTYTVKFPNSLSVHVEAPTDAELKVFNGPEGIDFVGTVLVGSKPTVMHKHPGPELGYWASVIEKAHRYLTGDAAKDTGEDPAPAIRLLTGVDEVKVYTSTTIIPKVALQNLNVDPKSAWYCSDTHSAIKTGGDFGQVIQQALAEGKVIVAATAPQGDEWVKSPDDGHNRTVAGHLLPAHAYSVVGYEPASGNKEAQIVLRNPWGDLAALGIHTGDGYFKVSVNDLQKLFDGVWIGG